MGRKETISALVGGMIAFAAYEWQAETAAFFDSIVPNAGYYAVRIIFIIAAIYVIAVVVHWFYEKRKKHVSPEITDRQEGHGQLVVPFKFQEGTTTATISVSAKPVEVTKTQRNFPQFLVDRADEDSDKFKQFEIAFKERREPVKAHFEFVTIKNQTGPAIRQMEATYLLGNAVSRKVLHWDGPFMFIFSIHSDHLTVHHEDMTLAQFRKHYFVSNKKRLAEEIEAEVVDTDDDKLASRSIVLNEGQSKTVGLAIAFEDLDRVFLPNSSTRSWVLMPCSFDIDLSFFGDPALSPEPVRFHVEAVDWKSLRIKRLALQDGQLNV
jgi:hypothetical protein